MIDNVLLNDVEGLIFKLGNKIKDKDIFKSELIEYLEKIKLKKDITKEIQEKSESRNKISFEIGKLIKSNDFKKAELLKEKVNEINIQIKSLNEQNSNIYINENFLHSIPNIPNDNIPRGIDESENKVVYQFGEIPKFNFEIKDHVDISKGKLDFEMGTKISKPRFCFAKEEIALINRKLINFIMERHIKNGYTEYSNVPTIVNRKSLFNTGQLPKFEDELFWIEGKEFALIPTAEVPLTNLFSDTILNREDLPKYLTAHTLCYRSEAGSYGKDLRGLIRQHQFEKIELVKIVHPEESYLELDKMLKDATDILEILELPYRVVELCDGDIGFGSAKTYDIEVWIPSQNKYREISSCSNMTDFQARRMNAKFRDGKHKKYVHTLNGSALPLGRTLVAILENYQREDGFFTIPKILRTIL